MSNNTLFQSNLESEAIYIMREIAAQFSKPVLLFSGGKDSITLVRLAQKAFYPGKIPFPLLHVDTGHNFPETLEYRDWLVEKLGLQLIVAKVQDAINDGKVREESGRFASRNHLQIPVLLEAIEAHGFDVCIGGARRDEEKARAKERVFSVRDDFGQWNARDQRPEFFHMLNGMIPHGYNIRAFPLSNWTELDVWEYIRQEKLKLPPVYFSHKREVFKHDGQIWPVSPYLDTTEADTFITDIRFRTVGDMTCTAAVESGADSLDEIISEIKASTISERGARMDDKRSEAAMEERKMAGYF